MERVCKMLQIAALLDIVKCSLEYVWLSDANQEISDYLNSPRSVINTDLRFITGGSNYLIDLMLHNMTK